MRHCKSCGSDSPVNARFCGNCGRLFADGTTSAIDITYPPATDSPAPQTPPLFSSPSYPNIQGTGMGWQDTDAPILHDWAEGEATYISSPIPERETEESKAVLPDVLLPGMLAMQGQIPSPAQAPMVQGTPHVGQVPSIQGTPPVAGNAPPAGSGLAHGAGSSATSHAPTGEPQTPQHMQPQPQPNSPSVHHPHPEPLSQPHHSPVHHPQPSQPPHSYPVHHPQPTQPLPELEHHHHHRHHTGPLRAHRPHASRLTRSATVNSKVMVGTASKWLIVALIAAIVIATSGVLVVLADSPGLSLSGNSTVAAGQVLHLHGNGFFPGGSVTLSLDNGSPISLAPRAAEGSANVAGSSHMLVSGLVARQAVSDTSVSVGPTGSFDANVPVLSIWSTGAHTLRAQESFGSRKAALQFTIIQTAAKLTVTPLHLNLIELQQGTKAFLSVMVGNAGGRALTWTADTVGTPWLKAETVTGRIVPGSLPQTINVSADATHLKVGNYSAILRISSNAGEARVGVTLKVIPPNPKKQAKLDVNPSSLDFSSQSVGKQVTQGISIGNLGTQTLNWQANTENTSWLTLANTTGKILPGQISHTIYVTADTTHLKVGNYSANINLMSDGGSAKVIVTLAVVSLPVTHTPTAVPTNVPPPNLLASPTSFNGNRGCSYTQGQGWMCVETLSSGPNAQSNLNWTASSSGIHGIAFFPAKGTLTPGQPSQVNILVPDTPCPANVTFTFADPVNTVSIPWSCTPPPAMLTVIPSMFSGNIDCTTTQRQGWSCVATLNNQSSKSSLTWSATASGIAGISFTPPNGTLPAAQSQTVTITVPNSTCPANATLTFTGAANQVNVPWSCIKIVPANLTVNPTSLDFGTLNGGGSTGVLPVQVGNAGGQPLTWKLDSTSLPGWLSVDTDSGTIPPGNPPQTVNVTADTAGLAPGKNTASVHFTSNGGNAQVAVLLVVAPTLIWSVNPTSFDASTCDESTPCTVTLTEDASSTGNINWSASSKIGATFNPPTGTLSPGKQASVTISAPCHSDTFTFIGSGGANPNPLTVSWNCVPPPIWMVSPTKLTNADVTNCSGGTTWTCMVTLKEDASSQADIIWSSSSDQKVKFSPPSGTLSPGQSVQVTVSSIPCNHTEFNFTGSRGAQPLTALWDCQQTPSPTPQPPKLAVTASGNCPPDTNGNAICTDTLTITGSQGSISWSVNAESDLSGTTFNPQSGTLSAGQSPQQVTVTIPRNDCPAGGHYDYSWTGSHSSRVTFTCSSPTPTPQPQPTPTSPPQPTPTPTSPPQPTPTSPPQPTPTPTSPPQPTPTSPPQPTPTTQPGLSFLFIPSMILLACMTRFYEYISRTKHRKRKSRR